MTVQWSIDQFITEELGFNPIVSKQIVNLFENGCEVPFIARYRRHMIGDSTPDDLRHALDAFNNSKMLKAKAEKLIRKAEAEVEDVKARNTLKDALSRTMDAHEMDSLFLPFKRTKNGTLASRAIELGVDAVSERILRGEFVDMQQYVNTKPELDTLSKVEDECLHILSSNFHHLEATQSLIQKISEIEHYMGVNLTVISSLTKKASALKHGDKDYSLIEHFKLYTNFYKDVRQVQPFQVLALERANSKGIISWKIRVDENVVNLHPVRNLRLHSKHSNLIEKALQDSIKRFLLPSIERRVRRKLLNSAERSAIDCFALNLRQLLLTAPIKENAILAIDPGYSNGCKCALVDEHGTVIDTAVFYLVRMVNGQWCTNEHGESIIKILASKAHRRQIIVAIGNGKGSKEVQTSISSLIKRQLLSAQFCVVSECGASIYSASELAAAELPDVDINIRSAISIARRLIDPISELVKIAPKHLGVGLYQHSINQKRLDEMLDIVVRECVSTVGVDINAASLQVLQKISGLNKKTAASIIKYREENGRINSREEIKGISGIGPKSFEQCAGFLYVYDRNVEDAPVKKRKKVSDEYNALDSTAVHPESYNLAEKILAMAGTDSKCISSKNLSNILKAIEKPVRLKGAEWILVWDLLSMPFVRSRSPVLLSELREIGLLKENDVVEGVVRNHAQFGVFVDIGVGFDTLAHSSTLKTIVPEV